MLGRTVPEIEVTLTAKDVAEAMAYERIEPFYYRDDYRIAMLCCLISNIVKAEKAPPHDITDFMPFTSQRDRQKQLVNKIKGIFGGNNSKNKH